MNDSKNSVPEVVKEVDPPVSGHAGLRGGGGLGDPGAERASRVQLINLDLWFSDNMCAIIAKCISIESRLHPKLHHSCSLQLLIEALLVRLPSSSQCPHLLL